LANEFLTSRLPRFTAVGGLSIYANITVAEEVSGESKSSVLLTKPNEPAERLKKKSIKRCYVAAQLAGKSRIYKG
jgi:hypothetical protein